MTGLHSSIMSAMIIQEASACLDWLVCEVIAVREDHRDRLVQRVVPDFLARGDSVVQLDSQAAPENQAFQVKVEQSVHRDREVTQDPSASLDLLDLLDLRDRQVELVKEADQVCFLII